MLRLGIVDFDTSHVVAFTQRLNHVGISEEQWVDGARVVIGCPGTSQISPERIPGFTSQLREYGIQIVDDPAEMIGQIDAVLIESVDGSVHLERSLPFIEAGIPMFVDKPFTTSRAAAQTLVDAAQRKGIPLMSASALRYTPEIVDIRSRRDELGEVVGCDAITPASLHPRNPGLFHYGVHGVEMVYALMGTGCRTVRCISTDYGDIVAGRWSDGRLGTVRGVRRGAYRFTVSAVCEKQIVATPVDGRYYYREMLKQIVAMFSSGNAPISMEELVEVVAFQEAALRSAEQNGAEIALDNV